MEAGDLLWRPLKGEQLKEEEETVASTNPKVLYMTSNLAIS